MKQQGDTQRGGWPPAGAVSNLFLPPPAAPSNWDFGSSFFFAGTVVTTIGKALGWRRPTPVPLLKFEFPKSSGRDKDVVYLGDDSGKQEKRESETGRSERAKEFAIMSRGLVRATGFTSAGDPLRS